MIGSKQQQQQQSWQGNERGKKEHERVVVRILHIHVFIPSSSPPSTYPAFYFIYDNFSQSMTEEKRTTQKVMTFFFAFSNVK